MTEQLSHTHTHTHTHTHIHTYVKKRIGVSPDEMDEPRTYHTK